MNELRIFENREFGSVKVLVIDNKEWFVAKEVAKVLGYTTLQKMYQRLDKDEQMDINPQSIEYQGLTHGETMLCDNPNTFKMKLINKKGVLRVLTSSYVSIDIRKKVAKTLLGINNFFVVLNRKELEFLDTLEKTLEPFNIKGIKQYKVLNYRIDYYIPSLNIAIEYDENDHSNYTYESHEGRQIEIEKELGCRFIRLSDKISNEYNVGYVIKKIFNL